MAEKEEKMDLQAPEVQIAWAKIVARAAVDEQFRSRLKESPAAVFQELGIALNRKVDLNKDFSPSLDEALASIERQRAQAVGSSPAFASTGAFGSAGPQGGQQSGQSLATMVCYCNYCATQMCMCQASGPVMTAGSAASRSVAAGQSGQSPSGSLACNASVSGCFCGSSCSGSGGSIGGGGAGAAAGGGGTLMGAGAIAQPNLAFNCRGTLGTAGSFGSVTSCVGTLFTGGSFGCAVMETQLGGSPSSGATMSSFGTYANPVGGQSGAVGGQFAGQIGTQAARFNCWGSAGTAGSAYCICGTAGSFGTVGTFGCGAAMTGITETALGGTSGSWGSVLG